MNHEELVTFKGVDVADLCRQLRAAPAILRAAVADLTLAELEARPIPDKWSTRGVVEHVALVSLGWTDIFYEATGKAYDNVRNHDLDWSASESARAKCGVAEALDVYDRHCHGIADYLQTLPPADWTRRFPAVQWLPHEFEIRDHLHWGIVGHLHYHLKFIVEKRAALGKPLLKC
ncbi:MAG: DinB family protein [Phycisphaerae bacterium]